MTTRRTAPARPTVRIALASVGNRAHLTRGAERYCRLPEPDSAAPTTPRACEWHTEDTYPGDVRWTWDFGSSWTIEAARALLPLLVGLDARGRPSAAPVTDDGALVARAMAATGLRTMTALARLVGTTTSQLSRCNVAKVGGTRGSAHPLTPEVVTALEGLVSKAKEEKNRLRKKEC